MFFKFIALIRIWVNFASDSTFQLFFVEKRQDMRWDKTRDLSRIIWNFCNRLICNTLSELHPYIFGGWWEYRDYDNSDYNYETYFSSFYGPIYFPFGLFLLAGNYTMVELINIVLRIPKKASVQNEIFYSVGCFFLIFWVIYEIIEFFFG